MFRKPTVNSSNYFLHLQAMSSTDEKNMMLDNGVRVSNKLNNNNKNYVAKLIPDHHFLNETLYYPVIFDPKVPANKIQLSIRLKSQLNFKTNSEYKIELIEADKIPAKPIDHINFAVQRTVPYHLDTEYTVDCENLANIIKDNFKNYPFNFGQSIIIPNEKFSVEVRILSINGLQKQSLTNQSNHEIFYLNELSQVDFSIGSYIKNIKLINNKFSTEKHEIEDITQLLNKESDFNHEHPKKINLDFMAKGIGGYKKELDRLVREAFYSRVMGNFAKAYGAKHTKGILLYGPPGTGKTQLASEVGYLLPNTKVIVVNGPELKSKYVGQSQENIRSIFLEAETEWKIKGDHSRLYYVILDEIDAICPARGTRQGNTGTDDDNVAQFLTKIEGVNSAPNILIVGTTNRKDLIDPAILRPGRLEVHIKLGLPDEEARLEILIIKTNKILSFLLDDNVNLNYWAKVTGNFTGAELDQLVRKAQNYAMGSNFDYSDKTKDLSLKEKIKSEKQLAKVTQEHFIKAFAEITPAFGINKNNFNFDRNNFVSYSDELAKTIINFNQSLKMLQKSKDSNVLKFLISGASGVGKTDLAKYLAIISQAKYIKLISPDQMLGLSLQQQLNLLDEEFSNAQHSDLSVIILDELENILQADAFFASYSNHLRIKLQTLLKQNAENNNKCIIIATTNNEAFIKELHLLNLFAESQKINEVTIDNNSLFAIVNSLNYKFIPAKKPPKNELTMPIRDLIYKIRKFCTNEAYNGILYGDLFFDSLEKEVTDPLSFLDSLNALKLSGSPVYS